MLLKAMPSTNNIIFIKEQNGTNTNRKMVPFVLGIQNLETLAENLKPKMYREFVFTKLLRAKILLLSERG